MYWRNRDRMSFLTSAATHIEVYPGVLKSGIINAEQSNRFEKANKSVDANTFLCVKLLGLYRRW